MRKRLPAKSKHIVNNTQIRWVWFDLVHLKSDFFLLLHLALSDLNWPKAHFAFVIAHAVRLLQKVQLHAFHCNNYFLFISGKKKSQQASDRHDQHQQQRGSLLIGFSFCSHLLYVIYHRKLCSYIDWGVLIYNHVRVSLTYSLFFPFD